MVEIPSLYELACHAYDTTEVPGYQEAFEQAMMEGEKPCLILVRATAWVEEIPYKDGIIRNPFVWRVAYVDEERFGLHGPLQNNRGEVSQVAVIEEHTCDPWGNEISPTRMSLCRSNNLRGWARRPYGWVRGPYDDGDSMEEGPNRPEGCLYPCSIIKELQELIDRYDPDEHGLPIEQHWFEDAELPLRIIDGVPESVHHSLRRNRRNTRSGFMPYEEGTRDYLNDPTWYIGLN